MPTKCIAIMAPGDMGHAVARVLGNRGYDVITCLAGRSERTRSLAAAGNLRDVPNLETLVGEADMILSILPPASAVAQAEAVADAMKGAGTTAIYVDCNAVSPGTVNKVAVVMDGAGAPVIDCGIIGLAPGRGKSTRFYVSGADTSPMLALDDKGIEVISVGTEIGRASGLKMAYAGLTKGTWTLHTAVLLAAERMGLTQELLAEFEFSQPAALAMMEARVSRLPADSERWIGEMEEIAATFRDTGVTGGFHDGAADIFRVLARTPFASETRETIDDSRSMEESITVFANYLSTDKDE